MSTGSIVAIPVDDTWQGRYVHSGGYPSGVGLTLWNSYHDEFFGDLEKMQDKLILHEKVGWSALCGHNLALPSCWVEHNDFPQKDGFIDYERVKKEYGPRSYTERGETGEQILGYINGKWETAGTEWAYVLCEPGIIVLKCHFEELDPTMLGLVLWSLDPNEVPNLMNSYENGE